MVLDAATLKVCPSLKLICICATGTNNVDLDAAAAQGITVCNVTGYARASVAQHTLALLLSLAARLVPYHEDVRSGRWSQAPQFCLLDHPMTELAGKTFGVIGYGDLGREAARLAEAFGMTVQIAESFQQTDQLVDAAFLSQMKPGALLLNTARGGLIDELALADALRSGQLGGAGLDVLSSEPPPADHPLLADGIPNLLITPHNAWGTRESRQRVLEGVVENIRQWQAGSPINVVS